MAKRTREQNRAAYERRQDRAQRLGYASYSERRRALETGTGRLGDDRTEGDKRKRVREFGSRGGEVVQLTANNRGGASVESRVSDRIEQGRGDETVTISYIIDGRSGPIRQSFTMSYDDFWDTYDGDAADAAGDDADDKYSAGISAGVGNVQVVFR